MIEFTEADLKFARSIPVIAAQLDWLEECARRPDARPPLVHRVFIDDPSAHASTRDCIADVRRRFYDKGQLSPAEQFVVAELYRMAVY